MNYQPIDRRDILFTDFSSLYPRLVPSYGEERDNMDSELECMTQPQPFATLEPLEGLQEPEDGEAVGVRLRNKIRSLKAKRTRN